MIDIVKLFDCLDDEIEGIKTYSKLACRVKDSEPDTADALYKISLQEEQHYQALLEVIHKTMEKEELDDTEKNLCIYILGCKTKCHEAAIECQQMYGK